MALPVSSGVETGGMLKNLLVSKPVPNRKPGFLAMSSVSELLKNSFSNMSLLVQKQIVSKGRVLLLKNLPLKRIVGKNNDGHFCDQDLYEKVPWLIRCDKRRKFFCWNCLLFMPSSAMLIVRANAEINSVLECLSKHELTSEHKEATLKLQIFIWTNFRTAVDVQDKTQHNLAVKRNREVLKRIIGSVCCAVALKHSRGNERNTWNFLKAEDCSKCLVLLKDQDKRNVDLVDEAFDVLKKYPRVMHNLVDAITRVLKRAIKNETHQSTYVSLILSEHGATRCRKSQISTVLRYIKRGKVCERFIGFTNVLGGNTEKDILDLVLDTIEQYHITDRFLALSVDGKVLPKQLLTNLIAAIKTDYQYSYFVPWHSHGFGTVLLQTLSLFDECETFTRTINAMEIYLKNSRPRECLEVTLLTKNAELRETKWHENAPFIIIVAKYRFYFAEFFDGMIKNCKYWIADDMTKAVAYRDFLQEIPTVFLLHLCIKVFVDYFDETFNFAVQKNKEMCVYDNPSISNFKRHVGNLIFDPVWEEFVLKVNEEGQNSKLALQMDNSLEGELRLLFDKVLRRLYQEAHIRCNYLDRLKFCDLFNCDCNGRYYFSSQLVSLLIEEHGPFFREKELRAEVTALNANSLFRNKSVHDLLECFADLNLRSVFTQLYKLAEFILTLPFHPASRDKGTSKLAEIDNCSYIPEITGIPSGEVSVLCVESEMLRDVQNSAQFYDDVLASFYEANKTFPLVQV